MKKEEVCGRELLRRWSPLRGAPKKHWLIFAIVMAAFIGFFILLDMACIGSRHRPVPPPAMVYHSARSIA